MRCLYIMHTTPAASQTLASLHSPAESLQPGLPRKLFGWDPETLNPAGAIPEPSTSQDKRTLGNCLGLSRLACLKMEVHVKNFQSHSVSSFLAELPGEQPHINRKEAKVKPRVVGCPQSGWHLLCTFLFSKTEDVSSADSQKRNRSGQNTECAPKEPSYPQGPNGSVSRFELGLN